MTTDLFTQHDYCEWSHRIPSHTHAEGDRALRAAMRLATELAGGLTAPAKVYSKDGMSIVTLSCPGAAEVSVSMMHHANNRSTVNVGLLLSRERFYLHRKAHPGEAEAMLRWAVGLCYMVAEALRPAGPERQPTHRHAPAWYHGFGGTQPRMGPFKSATADALRYAHMATGRHPADLLADPIVLDAIGRIEDAGRKVSA